MNRNNAMSLSMRVRVPRRISIGHQQGRHLSTEKATRTTIGPQHSLYLVVPIDRGQSYPRIRFNPRFLCELCRVHEFYVSAFCPHFLKQAANGLNAFILLARKWFASVVGGPKIR